MTSNLLFSFVFAVGCWWKMQSQIKVEHGTQLTRSFSISIFAYYSHLYLSNGKIQSQKAWKESGTRSQHFKSNSTIINIFAVVRLSKILSYYQKDNGNSWFTEFWLSLSLCSLTQIFHTERREKIKSFSFGLLIIRSVIYFGFVH